MSTQAARSIRFTHSSPQQYFRLLELQPELLELLLSEDPPTLFLKSPPPEALGSNAEAGTHDYVNLCTPTKTFRLRQVHSSNSIYLIRPSDGKVRSYAASEEIADVDFTETVTAIAKCSATLELHDWEEGFLSTEILEQNLRLYDRISTDGDIEMGGGESVSDVTFSQRKRMKEKILRDVPTSISQCERAWTEICAFVHGDTTTVGVAGFRPSARVKLDVWKRMFEGCLLQGINVEKQFLVNDLWKSVLNDDGEEPFPRALFEAVLRRVTESFGSYGPQAYNSELKWSNMDKAIGIRWIGETYLEVSAPAEASAIGRSEFINAWRDLLPESWREQASLKTLTEGSYKYPDLTSVCFVKGSERHKMKKEILETSGAATMAKNSRNWHERFKSQRR